MLPQIVPLPPSAPDALPRRLTELIEALAPEARPATWLRALHDRLWASLKEYRRRSVEEPGIWRTAVPYSEVLALNADLALVCRINAVLPHHRRSARVAGWSQPVIPQHVLLGPRDLFLPLTRAVGLVGCALEQLNVETINAL